MKFFMITYYFQKDEYTFVYMFLNNFCVSVAFSLENHISVILLK